MRSPPRPGASTRVRHTSQIGTGTLAVVRALLEAVFDDADEHAWDHALGGMHALVYDGGRLVAHGSVVQRRLLHAGRSWRTGYVEAVAVRAECRGRGHGRAVMECLEGVIRAAYELGALGASEMGAGFYGHRGWRRWRGPSSALTPAGVVRTPEEDDGIYVLEVAQPLDLAAELTCDWREGELW